MARTGVLTGPGAQETSGSAGRFAALLDTAGAARDFPAFGSEGAFLPPENAPASPVREPDRLYDSRPPDTVPPSPPAAEESPEAVSQKAETSRTDDRAGANDGTEAPREDAAAVFLAENAESRAEGAPVENREAELAENAENAPPRIKQGREKSGIPGEDLEKIPGFEEGVLANAEPGMNRPFVISGEPEEASDDASSGVRLARSAKPEKPEAAEKPETAIAFGTAPAASLEDEAAVMEAAAAAEKSGADLAGAEASESAAERERPEQDARFLRTGTVMAAEAGLENAAAELAALLGQQKSPAPEPAEKEGGEEPGEAKKGERRKLNLELRDFRTTPKADATAGNGNGAAENSADRAPGDYSQNHGREQEIIVDLKSQARSQAEVSYNRESRSQLSFRQTLARELHENLNGDIVRHASVILKDGGEGLIRLSLRPEHLGNVKIRLEMSENKVVGRITVESGEALRAFEQELRSLEQAFRDSGFEGATLEMSVSSDGGRGGAGSYRENGEDAPFFSERLAAHSYDAASGTAGEGAMTRPFTGAGAERQVDVLA
jgi:flagellar hook-length control protein FliK